MTLTKTKIKNIMFDLDGTLIDSSFDVTRILIATINKHGGNLESNATIKIGPPLIDMIASVTPELSNEVKQNIVDDFRIAYERDHLEKTNPFNGIIEILNNLKTKNIDVFIVTYKPKNLAMNILNRHFNGLYKDIVTPSEVENFSQGKTKTDILNVLMAKWSINAEESVMIGDAKSDITCANEAGLLTVGALYGYGEENEFDLADKKVSTINDLSEYIDKIIKG